MSERSVWWGRQKNHIKTNQQTNDKDKEHKRETHTKTKQTKNNNNKYQKSASVIRLKELLILFAIKCVKYI